MNPIEARLTPLNITKVVEAVTPFIKTAAAIAALKTKNVAFVIIYKNLHFIPFCLDLSYQKLRDPRSETVKFSKFKKVVVEVFRDHLTKIILCTQQTFFIAYICHHFDLFELSLIIR